MGTTTIMDVLYLVVLLGGITFCATIVCTALAKTLSEERRKTVKLSTELMDQSFEKTMKVLKEVIDETIGKYIKSMDEKPIKIGTHTYDSKSEFKID